MSDGSRHRRKAWRLVPAIAGLLVAMGMVNIVTAAATSAATVPRYIFSTSSLGGLDCNGYSSSGQKDVIPPNACTDIHGMDGVDNANTWDGRFYDNGHYIGHDEPDMTFFSNQPGSGDNVNWSETLPKDPVLAPTVATPGSDVTHWVELTPAPWFGMDLCDSESYPQTPCVPNSDSNAPACSGPSCSPNAYPGGGSAFLEMQFYPPGEAPFVENISCDNTHWCASLHINEFECTEGFVACNALCEETTNFAFVQTNGVPTGPPGPETMTEASGTPNAHTLLMSPGDNLKVHIWDAPAPAVPAGTPGAPPGGIPAGHALEVSIDDTTSGEVGYMQASAANGFMQTDMGITESASGPQTCGGSLYNFEPEYSTARVGNIAPWAALASNISTEFEIGHFEPCTMVTGPNPAGGPATFGGDADPAYNDCVGPYDTDGDSGSGNPEGAGEAYCYPLDDTHGTLDSPPNIVGGCEDNWFLNGDLDYDGTPYYADWPTSAAAPTATSRVPQSFVQAAPTTVGGRGYPEFMFQTDAALSESACQAGPSTSSCLIPPPGPGHFYPYWSEQKSGSTCSILFGNVASGTGVNDFGKYAQYGTVRLADLGYPEFESKIYDNTCNPPVSQGYLMVGSSGRVVAGGDAPALPNVHSPSAPVVGIAATPSGKGYYSVSSNGAVYTAGDAPFEGDLTTLGIKVSNIVAIAPTTNGKGYWLIGRDGGLFAFGDARYRGSIPGLGIHVNDIIGMVAAPSGEGYLIVGSDGGVFAFGRTHFYGSLPGIGVHVNDIRGILPSAAGTGYILVGADGGAFVFGHGVPYHGSLPGEGIHVTDIVGIALTTDNGGYWMAGSSGTVYPFGDARNLPNDATSSDLPIVGIAGVLTDSASAQPVVP